MKIFPITKERYVTHAKTKVRLGARSLSTKLSPVQQFTPISLRKTNTEFCVLGNGPYRSGTYLLHKILLSLGKWEDIEVHINPGAWFSIMKPGMQKAPVHYCSEQYAVNKVRNGQMVAGHLTWHKDLERNLERVTKIRRYKHVFIYRDPRDCYVSRFNYHSYGAGIDAQTARGVAGRKAWLENFPDDDARLSDVIEHRSSWRHLDYVPWLHSSHCFAVKFEDLDADCNALEDGLMGNTLKDLFNYLEVEPANIDPIEFFNNDLRTSHNSSGEKTKVGQYKRVFKDQHYAMLDTSEFRETLQAYGYEW